MELFDYSFLWSVALLVFTRFGVQCTPYGLCHFGYYSTQRLFSVGSVCNPDSYRETRHGWYYNRLFYCGLLKSRSDESDLSDRSDMSDQLDGGVGLGKGFLADGRSLMF